MPKLPDIKGYANNVLKEFRQLGNSNEALDKARYNAKTYPYNSMRKDGKGREYWGAVADDLAKKNTKDQGQALGAVLQGRRYDAKGKQVTGKKK